MGNDANRRFALVVPALRDGGGVPAVAEFLYDTAREAGWEVRIISLSSYRSDPVSRALLQPSTWFRGVKVAVGEWEGRNIFHVGSDWADLEIARYRLRPMLGPLVRDCRFIQVVSGSAAWANCVIGLGKPVSLQVATRSVIERRMRDTERASPMVLWRRAMTQITDKVERVALRSVDAIQVENQWMLEFVRDVTKNVIQLDIRFAPPGVDTDLFHFDEEAWNHKQPYILSVGRLGDPRKNVLLLLEAFAIVAAKVPHVRLVTAGASDPPPAFHQRVAQLRLKQRISHISNPSSAELISLYQHALIFALSSDEEGLGIVLLESMSCGTAAVATRCGGPEGVITHGRDGFLVPRNDATQMAERLIEVCTDPELARRLGRRARQTTENRFSKRSAGTAFRAVWDSFSALRQ